MDGYDVLEPIEYNFILIKIEDNSYMGWSRAKDKPKDVKGLKWYPWGKELPEDIDDGNYIYSKGELIKTGG
jgi:hypothetical protein